MSKEGYLWLIICVLMGIIMWAVYGVHSALFIVMLYVLGEIADRLEKIEDLLKGID